MNQVALLTPAETAEPINHTFNWLLAHMDVSAETLQDYSRRLSPFLGYLLEHGINVDTLISYKRMLAADTSIKVSTKSKKLTVARIFLRALYHRGFIDRDITVGVRVFSRATNTSAAA